MLKQQKAVKAQQKSEQYWTMKKESTTPAVMKKGEKRLNQLISLSSSTDGTIRVKSSSFSDLITSSPRPYWTLLSLTALSSSYDCKVCHVAHTAFNTLAPLVHSHTLSLVNSTSSSSFNTLLTFNTTVTSSERERLQREYDDKMKKTLPIFIVEADIDDNRNHFNTMGLSSAPTIVLLPPSFSPRSTPLASFLSAVPAKYRYIPQSLDLTENHFIDFINAHIEPPVQKGGGGGVGLVEGLKGKVEAFHPVILSYFSVILSGVVLYLLIVVYRAYCKKGGEGVSLIAFFLPSSTPPSSTVSVASSIPNLNFSSLSSLFTRLPLILSSITFYLFCVSGGMFTIIKDSESGFTSTSTYSSSWVSGQYMDQTIAESTVLLGLYGSLATLMIVLNSRTFYWRREGGWKEWMGWGLSWVMTPIGLLVLMGLVWLQLINVYSKKNHYNWGVNWKWLKQVEWNKVIPYPAFHRWVGVAWKWAMKRMW